MSWKIEYNKEAVRNLEKISTSDKNKIFKGIESLKGNPDSGKQLVGPLKGVKIVENWKVQGDL